jgi:5'-nucleotidase
VWPLTGAQIVRLLEQQWLDQPQPRVLQVSGIAYAWQPVRPVGQRVDASDVRIGGQPLVLDQPYSVVVNSYLAEGGDNFTVLREGTDRLGGPLDLDALVDYLQRLPQPFSVEVAGRMEMR